MHVLTLTQQEKLTRIYSENDSHEVRDYSTYGTMKSGDK